MKRNKKLLVGIGVIALIGITLIGVYKNLPQGKVNNVIHIGAILPLTGAQAQDGVEIKNAMLLAANEINSNEDAGCKVQIDIRDSKYNSKDAITLFNAMMGKHPDVMVVGGSVISLSVAPLAQRYEIPVLSLLASDDGLPDENAWMFRFFPSDKEEIGLMLQYASEKLKVRKLAILTVDNIQGNAAVKYFKEYASTFGCEVCAEGTYAVDGMDMRPQVSKILKANPDSIYVFGYGIGFCTSINQIRELGYKKSILTWQAMSLVSYQDALKGDRSNIYFTAPQFERGLNASSCKLYDKYVADYKAEPGFIAAFAYETVRIIARVSQTSGQTATSFCSALKDVKSYESVTGEIGFNGQRGLQTSPAVFTISDGKAVRVR